MFRFTIRELVLLTLVVAMGVAWWVDHSRLKKDAGRTRFSLLMLWDAVRESGYTVYPGESLIEEQLERDTEPADYLYSHGMTLRKVPE